MFVVYGFNAVLESFEPVDAFETRERANECALGVARTSGFLECRVSGCNVLGKKDAESGEQFTHVNVVEQTFKQAIECMVVQSLRDIDAKLAALLAKADTVTAGQHPKTELIPVPVVYVAPHN
jgi:hypothetical protein